MIALHVEPPNGQVFEETLDGGVHVIGRSSHADVVIPDRSLSRQHAQLRFQDGSWIIEDLGSRNGTMVNRRRIDQPTALRVGDIVGLGASVLRVQEAGAKGGSAAAESGGFGDLTMFKSAKQLLEESSAAHQLGAAASDDRVRQYTERLRTLNEVHEALGRSVALEDLLDMILERAFAALRPEEGAVFLKRPDGEYDCAASLSTRGTEHRCLYSTNLIREVAEKGLAALVLDAEMDDRFNQAASILNAGVRSLVAAPLLDPEGPLGMMVLGSTFTVRQFNEEDMQLLVSLASVAAMRIRNLRLAEESAERKRLEREVRLAREIQMALLPDHLPDVPGCQLHGGNSPSRGVSGDLFKVVERVPGSDYVLFLADVSGKGIGASLLTASLEALIAAQIEQNAPPDQACGLVSRLLFQRTPPEKYATGFLGMLDAASGTVRFASAGHNPGLVVRSDGSTEWLQPTGMPLGILPVGEYTASEVTLRPGDTMVLYTDGITEAADPDDEEFGEERLEAVCVANRELAPAELAKAIDRELEAFAQGVPFADDRTMVIVRKEG
jgi:serine phosphatase RsbU (regulator of sigma subunit)